MDRSTITKAIVNYLCISRLSCFEDFTSTITFDAHRGEKTKHFTYIQTSLLVVYFNCNNIYLESTATNHCRGFAEITE